MVPLGGVVIDDVQDDFQACGVERLNHRLELANLATGGPGRAVIAMGGQKADAVIAPVVAQAPLEQVGVVHELMDRQQLHRGYPQVREVTGDCRVRQTRISAADVLGHVRVPEAQPFDMSFVNDGLVQRDVQAGVAGPVEVPVGYDAFGHVARRVGRVQLFWMSETMPEQSFTPFDAAIDRRGVGVYEQLGGVAAEPLGGRPRAVHPEAVALARADSREQAVPDMSSPLRKLEPLFLARPRRRGTPPRRRQCPTQLQNWCPPRPAWPRAGNRDLFVHPPAYRTLPAVAAHAVPARS